MNQLPTALCIAYNSDVKRCGLWGQSSFSVQAALEVVFFKISFIYYKIYITTVYFPIIYKVCIWFTWCRLKQWHFSPNYLLWLHKYKLTSARLLGTMHMLFIYAHAYINNLLYSLNVLLATPSLFNYTLIFRHPLIIQNVALTPPPFPLKKGGGIFFSPVGQRASHWTKSKFNMFDQYLKNHRLGLKPWYLLRSGWPLFILRSQGQGLCRFVIDWLIKCFPIDSNWQDEH